MSKWISVATASSRSAPVTEEEAARFLEDPARVAEEEWWRILARRKGRALSEDQILRAVEGVGSSAGRSIFPTARVAGEGAIAPLRLDYVRPSTLWLQTKDRGEIGTLPLAIRVLRLSVWLATGVLMVLGMYWK